MRFRAIICDVLSREFYHWAAVSEHIVDITALSSKNHEKPEKIHRLLQEAIKEIDAGEQRYDYLILGFGLCGKVLDGLRSGAVPIVIPRVHDCIKLFLGSGEKSEPFLKQGIGTIFYIGAWLERNGVKNERKELESIGLGGSYDEYVAKYGEEDAIYLMQIADEWKTRYNQALYVKTDLTNHDFSGEIEEIAKQRRWRYREVLGDSTLIEKMVRGDWPENDFQIIKPWHEIQQSYDHQVVSCVPCERWAGYCGAAN